MPKFDTKRQKVFNFIKDKLNDYDVERTDFEDWVFSGDEEPNIEKIYALNKKKLLSCPDSFIDYLLYSIRLIKKEVIYNMDKESMIPFPTSGFCWNAKGNFIFFNER
jgi:hypothetical protein